MKKFEIHSKYLNRKTPYIVQKPDSYQSSKKYPLVFMFHGYSECYEQWSQTTNLKKLANDYQMILICPEGFVSYYLNSPKLKTSQYEDFFFKELIPEIRKKFSVDSNNMFITGLSMGGYGALSFFIKHSDFFNAAASTSGGLEFDYDNLKEISLTFFENERMTDDLKEILGNHNQNDWNQFSISSLLEQNTDFNKGFLFDCGLEDPLFSDNVKVKELALHRNLPITFIAQPGEHNMEYWNKAIKYHFVYFKQHLKKETNMKENKIDKEIKNLTQQLIDKGTKYDLEFLDNIYHDNLKFVRIDNENNIEVLTKKDNMDFFTDLKNSGAKPLNNYAEFHYADNDGENGFVVLTRKMRQMEKEQEFLFNIYWKKINGEWKIIRETVLVR